MPVIELLASAKVNLHLRITGKREDGFHLLESLVVFAEFGDRLRCKLADQSSSGDQLSVSGPFAAAAGADEDNLVLKALETCRLYLKNEGLECPPLYVELEKNIPVGAGLGGGSADAAAAIKAAIKVWQQDVQYERSGLLDLLTEKIAEIGADVAMCLHSRPLIARGIGDEIEQLAGQPALNLLLVNPGVHVPTPLIFKTLDLSKVSFATGIAPKAVAGYDRFANDLEEPALSLFPVIGNCLTLLRNLDTAYHAGMSGSGSTCFAVFRTAELCKAAAEIIAENQPEWWVCQTTTIPSAGM